MFSLLIVFFAVCFQLNYSTMKLSMGKMITSMLQFYGMVPVDRVLIVDGMD